WQIPHTFSIAIKRYKEYKAAGVPMLPVVYGFDVTKRQIIVYIACLFPLPLFLISLGIPFIIVATLLNIAWLILAVRGFYTKDDWKWAHRIFISSLIYLSVLFIMMVIVTLPPFSCSGRKRAWLLKRVIQTSIREESSNETYYYWKNERCICTRRWKLCIKV